MVRKIVSFISQSEGGAVAVRVSQVSVYHSGTGTAVRTSTTQGWWFLKGTEEVIYFDIFIPDTSENFFKTDWT